ncbi:MAG TPA: acetylornithine deacetylase/succinyl-diaminopimelate desuccinylase family protein [Candidatus Acidoferrales bacterium]|nr:acetylornithine deacetylase/succinyl-diaminopimelate desuccinylase family protein [Candidatus Acidoferrales bacterium]
MGLLPIVFRLPSGWAPNTSIYHSVNPESWFASTPGLKIMATITAADAKGLLKAEIRDNNPVLFLEYKIFHRWKPESLSPELRLTVPEEDYVVPIGKARVVKEGKYFSVQSASEDAVLRRIESMTDEMCAFLSELIRIPTVNPPGENYPACAQFQGNKLEEFGYQVEYVAAEERPEHTQEYPRVNVIGRLPGSTARPLLHFNGHFDVVPVGEGWTRDPFGGERAEGKIFGRGSADQKSGIAASFFAVEAIRRSGIKLAGTIEQSGVVDEESGGFAGMAYLAQKALVHRDRTDYVIITEPLKVDRICLGHRGVYWSRVTTKGRIGHGSMPFLGVSAIDHMAEFLDILVNELKPKLTQRRSAMPVEPPGARYATINVNAAHGGQPEHGPQTPCVADRCVAILDRRFLIEESLESVRTEIIEILDRLKKENPQFDYFFEDQMIVLPVQTNPEAPLVTAVSGAIREVLGKKAPLIASPGTYDQKHVMRIGHVDQCIAYGPGRLELSHLPDEYCSVEDLVHGAQVMALSALRLVGITDGLRT